MDRIKDYGSSDERSSRSWGAFLTSEWRSGLTRRSAKPLLRQFESDLGLKIAEVAQLVVARPSYG